MQALQEFFSLVFSENMLELYANLNLNFDIITDFHKELAEELDELGNQYWLILRASFNHLMFMFARKPYLMSLGFEDFIVNFCVSREIRTLDSQIHLYRMETLLP